MHFTVEYDKGFFLRHPHFVVDGGGGGGVHRWTVIPRIDSTRKQLEPTLIRANERCRLTGRHLDDAALREALLRLLPGRRDENAAAAAAADDDDDGGGGGDDNVATDDRCLQSLAIVD